MLDMNWVRTQMNNESAKRRSHALEQRGNRTAKLDSRRLLVGLAVGLALSLGTGLAIAKQVLRPIPVQA
jgi:hypothetical protein